MTAFDKAWSVVKDEDPTVGSQPNFVANERQHMKRRMPKDTKLQDALDAARMRPKKKKPLELPGYVRTGSNQDGKG